MASNYRRNHEKQGTGGVAAKTGIFVVLAGLLYFGFQFFDNTPDTDHPPTDPTQEETNQLPVETFLLPTTNNGTMVHHDYFALSYVEAHEGAEWTAHYISRKRLNNKKAERKNWFEEDPLVHSGSADYYDYKGSGYDKGHLVPAADMGFSQEAMDKSFFMSNISPQVHPFNGGIWRELEEQARDWGRMFEKLHVVTGPVFEDNKGRIGKKNKVTVPGHYFKILLDIEGPEKKAIGFVIPNEVSEKPLSVYIRTIDEIEALTGIDFYPQLDDELEKTIEQQVVMEKWPFNNNLYKIRKEKWNIN